MADSCSSVPEVSATTSGQTSDQTSGQKCDPCRRERISIAADRYCIQCEDFVCNDCTRLHKKFRTTKAHVIKPTDAMPSYTSLFTQKADDMKQLKTDECENHIGTKIDYYCKTHAKACCHTCCKEAHGTCEAATIEELANGYFKSDAFKELYSKFCKIQTDVENMVETYFNEAKSKNKKFRADCDSDAERITKLVMDKCIKTSSDGMQTVQNTDIDLRKASLQLLKRRLSAAHCRIDSIHYFDVELFSYMNKIKADLDLAEEEMRIIKRNLGTPWLVSFNASAEVTDFFTKLVSIKRTNVMNLNMKQEGEQENHITALIVLSDGRLATADHANKSLKVYNAANKLVFNHALEDHPTLLVEIKKDVVGVVFENGKQIHAVAINGDPNTGEFCSFDNVVIGAARGVGDQIVVAFKNSLVTINSEGNILFRISKKQDGHGMFTNIRSITANEKTGDIYIVDDTTLKGVGVDRKILAEYSLSGVSDGLIPGLAIDTDDALYVSTKDNLLRLTQDLLLLQTLNFESFNLHPPYIRYRYGDREEQHKNYKVAFNARLGRLYIAGKLNFLNISQIC